MIININDQCLLKFILKLKKNRICLNFICKKKNIKLVYKKINNKINISYIKSNIKIYLLNLYL